MRWIISLLIIIFVMPLAMASISVEDVDNSQYNYGDSFDAVFDVQVDEVFKGYVNLIASCSEDLTLDTRMVNLKAGGSYSYDETYLITKDFEGSCNLLVERTTIDSVIVESASSNGFSVVGNLKGEFTINANEFQLGDALHFSGAVSDVNGMAVDGFATVFLKNNGITKFVESKPIVNGVFYYDRELSMVPAGDYVIEIKASDSYGNSQTFTSAASFRLYGGLVISTSIEEVYNPGDEIVISGTVKGDGGAGVLDIDVEVVFGDYSDLVNLESSSENFEFDFKLKDDIKSGEQIVTINADDAEGNLGSMDLAFNVVSVPTSLEASVISFNHLPNKEVIFLVNILDQAGDNIDDLVGVELFDPSGDKVDGGYFNSGLEGSFVLPNFAEPDDWSLYFNVYELESEVEFKVEEIIDLRTELDGQDIIVTNLGNVKYDDQFHIVADGLDFFKNLDIKVNKTDKFDLGGILDEGTYDIFVPFTQDAFSPVVVQARGFFEGIGDFFSGGVSGAAVFNGKAGGSVGIILIVLVVLGLFGFGYYKVKKNTNKGRKSEIHKGLRKKQELKSKGQNGIKEYKNYNANDVAYLRKQAMEAYEDQKSKPTVMGRGEYIDARPKPEVKEESSSAGGTIFDMFK